MTKDIIISAPTKEIYDANWIKYLAVIHNSSYGYLYDTIIYLRAELDLEDNEKLANFINWPLQKLNETLEQANQWRKHDIIAFETEQMITKINKGKKEDMKELVTLLEHRNKKTYSKRPIINTSILRLHAALVFKTDLRDRGIARNLITQARLAQSNSEDLKNLLGKRELKELFRTDRSTG